MSPKKEYGDFQTPLSLARQVSKLIRQEETHVRTIVEPTCGIGAFLQAIAEHFGNSPNYWGFDLNAEYVMATNSALAQFGSLKATIQQRDFYTIDWRETDSCAGCHHVRHRQQHTRRQRDRRRPRDADGGDVQSLLFKQALCRTHSPSAAPATSPSAA